MVPSTGRTVSAWLVARSGAVGEVLGEHLLVSVQSLVSSDANAPKVRVEYVGAVVGALHKGVPGLVYVRCEGDVLARRHVVEAQVVEAIVGRLTVRRLVREVAALIHVGAVRT